MNQVPDRGIRVRRNGQTIEVDQIDEVVRVKLKPHKEQQAKVFWFKEAGTDPNEHFEIIFKCCSPFEDGKEFTTDGQEPMTLCPNAIPGKHYPYVIRLKSNPSIMLDPTIVVEEP